MESSFLDLLPQIAVGAAMIRTFTLMTAFPPSRLISPLLNHAQKIRLHVERKLTDFVQEDRAESSFPPFAPGELVVILPATLNKIAEEES